MDGNCQLKIKRHASVWDGMQPGGRRTRHSLAGLCGQVGGEESLHPPSPCLRQSGASGPPAAAPEPKREQSPASRQLRAGAVGWDPS